jgi:hypothetical protein
MLIDRFLHDYEVTEACELKINASWQEAYAAIRETDFSDPVVNALFSLRALPLRIARRLHGDAPAVPAERVNFATLAEEGTHWLILGEIPGIELVVGSVGHFWRKDYGGRAVDAGEFSRFDEPGFAKLAVSFGVVPADQGRTIMRYEVRVASTDVVARRKFARYWRVARPGIALVMRRLLRRIKAEAERPTLGGRLDRSRQPADAPTKKPARSPRS